MKPYTEEEAAEAFLIVVHHIEKQKNATIKSGLITDKITRIGKLTREIYGMGEN